MAQHFLSYVVWLLKGLIGSETGTLTLENDRSGFTTDEIIFDSLLADVQAVGFPWFRLGAGCILTSSGVKYKLSFIEPGNTAGGEYASIREARRNGQRWKTALTHTDSQN